MKIKIKEVEPEFKPIEFIVQIDRLSDIAVLWAAFNTCDRDMRNQSKDATSNMQQELEKGLSANATMLLWQQINEIAKLNGLTESK